MNRRNFMARLGIGSAGIALGGAGAGGNADDDWKAIYDILDNHGEISVIGPDENGDVFVVPNDSSGNKAIIERTIDEMIAMFRRETGLIPRNVSIGRDLLRHVGIEFGVTDNPWHMDSPKVREGLYLDIGMCVKRNEIIAHNFWDCDLLCNGYHYCTATLPLGMHGPIQIQMDK